MSSELAISVGKMESVNNADAETRVHLLTKCQEKAWDDYVFRNRAATVFHLICWKQLIEQTFGFEPRYLLAESSGDITGILPLFLVRNAVVGRALISTPFAVYGGICASDENSTKALLNTARILAREEKVDYMELRSEEPLPDSDLHTKELYVTFQHKLPDSSEALYAGLPRDTRYMIRKGEKAGLRAISDTQQLPIFYDIYADSLRRLGTPVFGRRFFEGICSGFAEQCEITVIWNGERAVAGALSFRFRDWIIPYYGGSLFEGRSVAANNYLYWEIMQSAIARGLRYFDFGRSKLGTGAYAFKTQWNMRETALPYQYYLVRRKQMPNFSPANPRFKPATAAWKRLPLSVTNTLGPRLIRFFP